MSKQPKYVVTGSHKATPILHYHPNNPDFCDNVNVEYRKLRQADEIERERGRDCKVCTNKISPADVNQSQKYQNILREAAQDD